MDWSLCIATLNRRDALLRAVTHAVGQTIPPREVVVIDTSDDWAETARIVNDQIFISYPGIKLIYKTSEVRSSATQRNLGLTFCTSDIVFILDDDSFMFPDCAEEVMKIYSADVNEQIACVAISLTENIPEVPNANQLPQIEKKSTGKSKISSLQQWFLNCHFGRWFNRKILLQSKDELFIQYEGNRDSRIPEDLSKLHIRPVTFISGCVMTVRLAVGQTEPFDPALRYYAASEDLDVSYRYGRHGIAVNSIFAQLHHYEAASGRIKRKKVIIFQLLNMIIFIKRHCPDPDKYKLKYRILLWRRLLGEFLKDGLSGRLDFPQARGVLTAMCYWKKIWNCDTENIDSWYPEFQKLIIEKL